MISTFGYYIFELYFVSSTVWNNYKVQRIEIIFWHCIFAFSYFRFCFRLLVFVFGLFQGGFYFAGHIYNNYLKKTFSKIKSTLIFALTFWIQFYIFIFGSINYLFFYYSIILLLRLPPLALRLLNSPLNALASRHSGRSFVSLGSYN